jgi:hypothetical protein
MIVLFDFLSRRIAPLQLRSRPACMYTGENSATRLECGDGSRLHPTMLTGMLSKLSIDPSSHGFTTPAVVHTALLGPDHEVASAEGVAHTGRY